MPLLSTTIVGLQGAFNFAIGAGVRLFRSFAIKNCETLGFDSVPSIHAIGLLDINFWYVISLSLKNFYLLEVEGTFKLRLY